MIKKYVSANIIQLKNNTLKLPAQIAGHRCKIIILNKLNERMQQAISKTCTLIDACRNFRYAQAFAYASTIME